MPPGPEVEFNEANIYGASYDEIPGERARDAFRRAFNAAKSKSKNFDQCIEAGSKAAAEVVEGERSNSSQ